MHRSVQRAVLLQACAFSMLLLFANCQLILDDVVEENPGGAGQAGLVKEATNPLTKTLQWAVDNSDMDAMAARAQAVREGRAEPMKLDREVMDAIFGSKVSFLEKIVNELKEAVATTVDEEYLVGALENLEELVTDIDNANDLDNLGGVEPVLGLLSHPSSKVKTAALWVVGTTAQSNPSAQAMFMNYRVLPKLMAPIIGAAAPGALADTDHKLLAKALYALSTLLRGCGECLEAFLAQDGAEHLSQLLAAVSREADGLLPVKRKLVALIGDLVVEEVAPAATAALVKHFVHPTAAVRSQQASVTLSVARLLAGEDRELQEKALQTLLNLAAADGRAVPEMLEARLADIVQVVVEKAAEKMQGGEDPAWEDSLMLGRQLLDSLHNHTRNEEM